MALHFGTHVIYVPGKGKDNVIGHYLRHNGDGTDQIQTPEGIENVPRRDPTAADPSEDLGKTWHPIAV